MAQLPGKIAIVTGSGRGLGRAIACQFAAEGARVVVNGRRAEPVAATVRLIEERGGEAIGVVGDVAGPGVAEQIADAAVERWGGIDVLVNNAAIIGPVAPLGQEMVGEWLETLRINVAGPFLMTRAVVPVMRRAGRGKVIDVNSSANRGAADNLLPYRTAKAALLRMTTVLAEQLGVYGIDVNSFEAHATTPMVEEMATWDAQDPVLAARFRQRLRNGEPTPRQNAEVCSWLASEHSDGLRGRSIAWWMDLADLERLKERIVADPRALRMEMVAVPGLGLSAWAADYERRKAAPGPG